MKAARLRLGALIALALVGLVVGAGRAQSAPSELFFSEYIEGSSNNKALEIYNGTGAPIDLAANGYSVQMFFNGSGTAGNTVNLTGVASPGCEATTATGTLSGNTLTVEDQGSVIIFQR